MSPAYHALFQLGPDETPYRKLASEGVRVSKRSGAIFSSSIARRCEP